MLLFIYSLLHKRNLDNFQICSSTSLNSGLDSIPPHTVRAPLCTDVTPPHSDEFDRNKRNAYTPHCVYFARHTRGNPRSSNVRRGLPRIDFFIPRNMPNPRQNTPAYGFVKNIRIYCYYCTGLSQNNFNPYLALAPDLRIQNNDFQKVPIIKNQLVRDR
jgi:hypothetical protein